MPAAEFRALQSSFDTLGGVIDYVFLFGTKEDTAESIHREAALAGIAAIDRRLEEYSKSHSSEKHPIESFFRLRWDEAKLSGRQVSFTEFWGGNDITPNDPGIADGYKSAFFCPPYGIRGSSQESEEIFTAINKYVFGEDMRGAEIFAWSTDWSNYFEAGLEWWGAFYWTIRPNNCQHLVVVGASTTD